jgi:hypothetical protein
MGEATTVDREWLTREVEGEKVTSAGEAVSGSTWL